MCSSVIGPQMPILSWSRGKLGTCSPDVGLWNCWNCAYAPTGPWAIFPTDPGRDPHSGEDLCLKLYNLGKAVSKLIR